MELTLAEIARMVEGDLDGDGSLKIHDVAKIEEAQPGEVSFISNPKYAKFIETTRASAVIVSRDFPPVKHATIRTQNPYFSFLKILVAFHPDEEAVSLGTHPSAVIDASAKVGSNCRIGACVVIDKNCQIGDNVTLYPGVVIGRNAQVGDNTVLHANVVLRERVRIGKNVIIHSGTVVGSDGFGFAREGEHYQKIPQVGIVIIEDDVEIGSNCSIDRATLGHTIIRKGVKLDNLIQVAHNVEIGEDTVIAAQSGIAGSAKLGHHVVVGGQVGIIGHIEVGNNTTIAAQSGVSKSLPPDSVYFGYPARPIMQAKREEVALRKLPELLKRISALEDLVTEIKNK